MATPVVGGAVAYRYATSAPSEDAIRGAVVRIVTARGHGSGFVVQTTGGGPGETYIASSYHVVEGGEGLLVMRASSPKKDQPESWVAYPDAELWAFDAEADVAILRVRGMDAGKGLALAPAVERDAVVRSYGYPGSALTRNAGLVRKEGRITSMVKFPVFDRSVGRITKENATPGLLVSTDLEPGFSGGPTLDAKGRVVGINTLKDLSHRGQDGVVDVAVLRAILDRSKVDRKPTTEDAERELRRLTEGYLRLPPLERLAARESEWLASRDLPKLHGFTFEFSRLERDDRTKGTLVEGLSNRALLGLLLARVPGKTLDTWRDPAVYGAVDKCRSSHPTMRRYLGDFDTARADGRGRPDCDGMLARALAWDLTASTLSWDGKAKEMRVLELRETDPIGRTYEADVRVGAEQGAQRLSFSWEASVLRLRLFDADGRVLALKRSSAGGEVDLRGKWRAQRHRAPWDESGQESEHTETLSISLDGSTAGARHEITPVLYAKPGSVFACNRTSQIRGTVATRLVGTYADGAITLRPTRDAAEVSGECGKCACSEAPKVMVLKAVAGKLLVHTTSGKDYPRVTEYERVGDP